LGRKRKEEFQLGTIGLFMVLRQVGMAGRPPKNKKVSSRVAGSLQIYIYIIPNQEGIDRPAASFWLADGRSVWGPSDGPTERFYPKYYGGIYATRPSNTEVGIVPDQDAPT
jgi:hypothetical protein